MRWRSPSRRPGAPPASSGTVPYAAASRITVPNALKIERETTHFIRRWRRLDASVAQVCAKPFDATLHEDQLTLDFKNLSVLTQREK